MLSAVVRVSEMARCGWLDQGLGAGARGVKMVRGDSVGRVLRTGYRGVSVEGAELRAVQEGDACFVCGSFVCVVFVHGL